MAWTADTTLFTVDTTVYRADGSPPIVTAANPHEQKLGLSMMKLGGSMFLILLMVLHGSDYNLRP
jgi:hypothetical protein